MDFDSNFCIKNLFSYNSKVSGFVSLLLVLNNMQVKTNSSLKSTCIYILNMHSKRTHLKMTTWENKTIRKNSFHSFPHFIIELKHIFCLLGYIRWRLDLVKKKKKTILIFYLARGLPTVLAWGAADHTVIQYRTHIVIKPLASVGCKKQFSFFWHRNVISLTPNPFSKLLDLLVFPSLKTSLKL